MKGKKIHQQQLQTASLAVRNEVTKDCLLLFTARAVTEQSIEPLNQW